MPASMQIVRFGTSLLLGETKNAEEGLVHLAIMYEAVEGGWSKVHHESVMRVSKNLIVNAEYVLEKEMIEEGEGRSVLDVLHEEVVPHLSAGKVQLGESELIAYQRNGNGIGISIGEDILWVPLAEAMTNNSLGEFLALEAHRSTLKSLGLVESAFSGNLADSFIEIRRPVHAYMKVNPLRDVTTLHERTPVSIVGFNQGCAVIDADGEEFYRPIEEDAQFWTKKRKDDDYYFNLDADNDNLPDPLQALPSKAGLNTHRHVRREDNFQVQPEMHKSAGHFAPIGKISNEDYGILGEQLGESYLGTHGFTDDERLAKPDTHDIGTEPGLDPEDRDAEVSKARAKKDDDFRRDNDGKDAVPQDYTGEYGDEIPPDDGTDDDPDGSQPHEVGRGKRHDSQFVEHNIDEILDRVMGGADVDFLISSRKAAGVREKVYNEKLKEYFPEA